jgi:chromosome partitioning protein
VLITPLNDSVLDIDVLAHIDWQGRTVLEPSVYSRFVAECRARHAGELRWIVFRNRLAHIGSRNMRDIDALMELLANRIGFRVAHGFGERVVFRELFSRGLTLFDVAAPEGATTEPTPSHRAAEAELASLLAAIQPHEALPA